MAVYGRALVTPETENSQALEDLLVYIGERCEMVRQLD